MNHHLGLIPDWKTIKGFQVPDIADEQLHIWLLPLILNEEQSSEALLLLSDSQHDKYHRRSSEELKMSYLAGRYFLFKLLAAYTKTEPAEVLLSYTRLNKPYLNPSVQDIHFNFTDTSFVNKNGETEGYGVFAFCKGRELGVDIEAINRSAEFEKIVDKRFSEDEKIQVTNADGNINQQKCLAYWTRKEAFGKATGKGLNYIMRDVCLANGSEFDKNFTIYSKEKHVDQDWRLQQLQISPDLIACLVHEGHKEMGLLFFTSVSLGLK